MLEATHLAGTVCAVLGASLAWTFVLVYWRRPWWRFEEGRHLMVFTAVIAVILTYVSWRAIGTPRVVDVSTEVARLGIFASLAALLAWRLSLLYRAK